MAAPGLIAKKLGMTQIFSEDGALKPVTVLEAGPCTVVQVKTPERDGYQAIQVGFGNKKPSKVNEPEKGHLKGQGPFLRLGEFRISGVADFELGARLDVTMFNAGDVVDVAGRSRGLGFAGGVKRHHFHGGPKTHGQSDRHRAPGSVGSTTTAGRVFKGLRMAGHMGDAQVTTRNLKIVEVQAEKNLLLVLGAIPGPKNSLVSIRPAKKVRIKHEE
ncbi:MAG: rplC [Dehalococcoidia bacterium]|nr:rplC [Dehalococcoidia bacterium]